MADIFRILEDVEEETFRLTATGCPDGTMGFFPFVDAGGLDVEVDEEGDLFLGGRHCVRRITDLWLYSTKIDWNRGCGLQRIFLKVQNDCLTI